ncbi:MAG: winged helix-turn-helix domain-containing protein [Euryarchaeota archaeon]|nr:winged helix-turn-helix domain-containing protein [Euryarchaeota archaeon]
MSQKRKDLLLLLKDGERTIEEIVDLLNVTQTGMLPQIKKLKDEFLVIQDDRKYRLTPLAEILVEKMQPLIDTLEVIEENKIFWQERDLSDLSPAFLERLNELKPYSLVKPDPEKIFEIPSVFLKNIEKSKNILSLFSIFHPALSGIFLRIEDDNIEISLIVTKRIYERLKNDFQEELKLYLARKNKQLFVCSDEMKIAMITKTDCFMMADFLTWKGNYDQQSIMAFEPASLKLAEDLILHYKDRAQKIKG